MAEEIVIVRHGQCTGNVADRASYKGDHSLYTNSMRTESSFDWPLTQKGEEEARLSGEWIRKNISESFDLYISSDYVRAIETGIKMGFSEAEWIIDPLLRERAWGGCENLPYPDRALRFESQGIPFQENSMDWSPPGGESMRVIIERLRFFLESLNSLNGKRVLIISHGGPIQAMRCIQNAITPSQYQSFINSDYIRNCHIFHYKSLRSRDRIPLYLSEGSAFLNQKLEWEYSIRSI